MIHKIILLRHGESADRQAGQTDFARTLTERGQRSILRLGDVLMSEKIFPDIIFSSNAVRAVQTTEAVSSVYKNPKPKIIYEPALYRGTTEGYLDCIFRIEKPTELIMIVGHNPMISALTGFIIDPYSTALHPGQAAIIQLNGHVGPASKTLSGKLIKLMGPFLN